MLNSQRSQRLRNRIQRSQCCVVNGDLCDHAIMSAEHTRQLLRQHKNVLRSKQGQFFIILRGP